MLSSIGVDSENIAKNRAPWHFALNFPVLDSRFFNVSSLLSQPIELCGLFIALPPQDQFDALGKQTGFTVRHTLDSVAISFDQRAERGGIVDTWNTGAGLDSGDVTSEAVKGYTLTLWISEKTPVAFGGTAPFLSDRDIWTASYNYLAATTPDGSLVPFAWENLNLQLDPYKTYIVRISAPGLATYNAALVSLVVDLGCLSTLMDHDTGAEIQNIPTLHEGVATADTVTVDVPAADAVIEAGTNTWSSKTFDDPLLTLDRKLLKRLWGGYGADSSLPIVSHIRTDAAYEIIAVPMFQNVGEARRLISQQSSQFPCLDLGPTPSTTLVDRRIVPLPWPIVIHHVLGVVSYAAPPCTSGPAGYLPQFGEGMRPTSPTLRNAVGVALGTGLRGDLCAYEQVAYAEWDVADAPDVDKFKQAHNGVLCRQSIPPDPNTDWDYEIRAIPIEGTGGVGLVPQGPPVYAGRATSAYASRTDMSRGHAPYTKGCEQFLQVNWEIEDLGGLGGPTEGGAAPTEFDTYAGEGGHWVLILCKKHLSGSANDVGV